MRPRILIKVRVSQLAGTTHVGENPTGELTITNTKFNKSVQVYTPRKKQKRNENINKIKF